MKKVKFFASEEYRNYYDYDNYFGKLTKTISDWTELSDQEYESLSKYKNNITSNLKLKGILNSDEELIVIREPSNEEVSQIMVDIKEIINSTDKKERERVEKERKRVQKLQQTAEEKKKEKELAQFKKLQEKYGK